MKLQITIDAQATIIWRYLPRHRATGYRTRYFHDQPGVHGGRFVPRRLGPSGFLLETTGQQSGFELWTEDEKLEVWPAQALAIEEIAAINTVANCITTRAGATIAAVTARKPLTEREYQLVQQERLIAGTRDVSEKKNPAPKSCRTCGWHHDTQFAEIVIPGKPAITLSGILPDIVACVHAAHAKGLAHLNTKGDELRKRCGGYGNPCKAFYDLGQRTATRHCSILRAGA
jgi:hypothetical protein